jgi:hypothetical protein
MFVQVFFIKEGVSYRIRIDFIVQREIVHGLKYVQKTYRMGVPGKTHIQYLFCSFLSAEQSCAQQTSGFFCFQDFKLKCSGRLLLIFQRGR